MNIKPFILTCTFLTFSCATAEDFYVTDLRYVNMDSSIGKSREDFQNNFEGHTGELILLRGRFINYPTERYSGLIEACTGKADTEQFIPESDTGILSKEEQERLREAETSGAFGWRVSFDFNGNSYQATFPEKKYKETSPITDSNLSELDGQCLIYLAEIKNQIEITSTTIISSVDIKNIYE